jgi:hypothetical protein
MSWDARIDLERHHCGYVGAGSCSFQIGRYNFTHYAYPLVSNKKPGISAGLCIPSDWEASAYAHSPWRITGLTLPSWLMPSISICPEPIIQSIWMRLLLPPCAAICSGVSLAPSMKHFE